MPMDIKTNFDVASLGVGRLIALGNAINSLVQSQKTEMQVAMTAGQDPNGAAFTALSENYAKLKQKWGRSGDPDLTVTGNMREAMRVEVNLDNPQAITAKIYIPAGLPGVNPPWATKKASKRKGSQGIERAPASPSQKAIWNNFGTNKIPARPFFNWPNGFAEKVKQRIIEALNDYGK